MEEFQCCNMSVPKISKIAGGILTAWGVFAYVYSGMESITAMIPAFMGVPILLIVGGVYTGICVKSFIHVRKQQDAE